MDTAKQPFVDGSRYIHSFSGAWWSKRTINKRATWCCCMFVKRIEIEQNEKFQTGKDFRVQRLRFWWFCMLPNWIRYFLLFEDLKKEFVFWNIFHCWKRINSGIMTKYNINNQEISSHLSENYELIIGGFEHKTNHFYY